MDEAYYNRVSQRLSLMKDGESFSVSEHTTKETREKFLQYFARFAQYNNSELQSWVYNDETDCIEYIQSVKMKNLLHHMQFRIKNKKK